MAQIHQQFERELPLSTLFLTPTIEGLASVLGQEADTPPWSPLVPIQPAVQNHRSSASIPSSVLSSLIINWHIVWGLTNPFTDCNP
jgi:hypothetical protein